MIIKEYIDRIQEAYSKGVKSQSSRLSNRHIFSTMVSIRKTLLSQKAKKKQTISSWSYQNFCIDMEYNASCNASVSKSPLPKALTDYNRDLIKSVRTVDGKEVFNQIEPEHVKYQKGNRYTSKILKFYIQDGYLYLNKKIGPKKLEVSMLADDPMEVFNIDTCNCDSEGKLCVSPLDMDFPIDGDLEETLIEMASIKLIQQFQAFGREDIYNNLKEDIQTAVQVNND